MLRSILLLVSFTLCAGAQLPDLYKNVARLVWVVPDVEKAAAAWTRTGLPVSEPAELYFSDAKVKGAASPFRVRVVTGRFGNVSADWMQPVAGDSPLSAFLKAKGGGVFALVYAVSSDAALAAETARLKSAGAAVLMEGAVQAGGQAIPYVFFDTAAAGKFVLGLAVLPPDFEGDAPRGSRVTQFAFVAREIEPVSAFWARLGWPAMTYTRPATSELVYRGKPGKFDMRLGWWRHGSVPFEWIEPLAGPSGYHEHLEKHGEGFHHLAFNVPDMDAGIRQWESWGFPLLMGGAWGDKGKPGSGRFAYHDLHAACAADIELLWNFKAQ
jgi:hypothetical protein